MARAERRRQATEAALALGLPAPSLAQFPAELSGGMQSRAALARALVLAPRLLLMDEPFSALDVGLRGQLHQLLLARQAAQGMAVLLITHDLMEAVRLADTVLVMAAAPGRIVARYEPPGMALARGDALVYRCTAELQQHPEVRAAFGLPGAAQEDGGGTIAHGHWQPVMHAAHPADPRSSC
jgi:NitT/TauT family transport system ATP-binding protein